MPKPTTNNNGCHKCPTAASGRAHKCLVPPRPSDFFGFQPPKSQKSFEKIARCARQEATKPDQNEGSALDIGKSEDPAKMTYSIPDFVSRDATHKSTNGPTNALKLGHKPQKQMPWGKTTNSSILSLLAPQRTLTSTAVIMGPQYVYRFCDRPVSSHLSGA